MRTLAYATLLALGGCASKQLPPPEPVYKEVIVKVPVTVPCKVMDDLGPEPQYLDSDKAIKAAPDLYARVKLLLQGRIQRVSRLGQYIAARASC